MAHMGSDAVISVTALTNHISQRLDELGSVQVRGEISQARLVASGHFYATLKDQGAIISVVCWRSTAGRLGNRLPKEGDEVVVRGSLSVYGPRGQYQLVASGFRAMGAGDLAARFEELKRQLSAEGLFAEERKGELPFLPHGIGIATASGSAAEADILDSIGTRFPDMLVTMQPCLVQGQGAAASIAEALQALDADPDVAVIIVGRGGGSLEDLWAFNEEVVVRAIAACSKPVISAVGHETDVTLADFVADRRAKTPTAAGELVVPVQEDLEIEIEELQQRLDAAMDDLLSAAEQRLTSLAHHRALVTPRHQWAVRAQRLDELHAQLSAIMPRQLAALEQRWQDQRRSLGRLTPRLDEQQRLLPQWQHRLNRAAEQHWRHGDQRFSALVGRLEALSPLAVIARGYGVITTSDGRVLTSVEQAAAGSTISAHLGDGVLRATVTDHLSRQLREASDIYTAIPPSSPEA